LWGELYGAVITRADLAHDDLEGSTLNIERALEWWHAGKFDFNGRPPRSEFINDMGSNRGETLYVGRRGSGKLLRIYEKGKQLGAPTSAWVRAEVELRNKGRTVPWEVVTHPGQYLAGAYPALRFLAAVQSRIRTDQRLGQISYDAMVKHLQIQGGKSLNVMCKVHQGDVAAVVAKLVREGAPKRLAGYEHVLGQIKIDDGSDS
jgi:phage replication initiation protein